jgi:glycosyltransferase involved in cell wall biosynthesis
VIIERYYNFGGEGLLAASAVGALAVLEVNAPIIDYAGSPKQWVDRALVVQPMRRWRNWQCTHTDLIVTPLSDIVPGSVPRERILEIEWGADTARFHPSAAGVIPFHREAGEIIVVFSGAFRAWHGAIHLVRAVAQLQASGRHDIKAVFIGDGPELERVRREASGLTGVIFTGCLPHNQMPACLAAADIGVAPFDVTAFGPLSLGFFWSPLKVFEYMAAGLPVVAPNIDRLSQLIEDGREGVLYDASEPTALAGALVELADSVNRQKLAVAARHRAVKHYGWDSHCRKLEHGIRDALNRRTSVG